MNRQDAHDAAVQDMMTAYEIFDTGDGDPEEFRRLVTAVIDRYELYRTAGEAAAAFGFNTDIDWGDIDWGDVDSDGDRDGDE